MSGAIDIVCNVFTPRAIAEGRIGVDADFLQKVRLAPAERGGVELEDYLRKMDRAGIERSLLIATRGGDLRVRGSFEVPYEYVADICRRWPDRFSGLAGIDPTRGMAQLRDLEQAVREYGFVGAHWYPHWFAMPPDAPRIYPVYAKCCELGVPIMLQVGQNLIYQRDRRLPSVAKPILLDQVAIDFPELLLIGIHIGTPWHQEMIAMAWKHPNVFIGTDAYAPRYWPPELVHFLNSYGRDKVLFGTDWPVVDPERAMAEIAALDLKDEVRPLLLRETARTLFKLP